MTAAAQTVLDRHADPMELHPVMGLIGALWSNFGGGKTAQQKRQMIAAWENALADIPERLQIEAVRRKAQAGQLWPPSSPAEVRKWCDDIQRPMNGMDAAAYRTAIDDDLLDVNFCRRQIAGYEAAKAAGRVYYAGWD